MLYTSWIITPAIHLSQNTKKPLRNAKNKTCTVKYFAKYFASLFSHFAAFYARKVKDFVSYFFMTLIKHEIYMKCGKRIASVSYFMVCFAKTFAKYPQNAKYKKCIAGLIVSNIPYAMVHHIGNFIHPCTKYGT